MEKSDLFANIIPFPPKPEGYAPEDSALLGGVVRVISDIHIRSDGFLQSVDENGNVSYQKTDPKLAKFVDSCIGNHVCRLEHNDTRFKRVLAVVLLGDVIETWALPPHDTTLSDEPEIYDQGQRGGTVQVAMEWEPTKWFFDQMERLLSAGIHVVYVLGNHDDLVTQDLAQSAVSAAYQRAHPNEPVPSGRGKFVYHANSFYFAGVLYQHGHQYDLFNKRFNNSTTNTPIDPIGRQVSRIHEIYSDAASPGFEKGYNLSALGAGLGLAETALSNFETIFKDEQKERGVVNARASAAIVLNNVLDGALMKLSGNDQNRLSRALHKVFSIVGDYNDEKDKTSLLNKQFRRKWKKIFREVLEGYEAIELERGLNLRSYIVGALPGYDFSDMLQNERVFYKLLDPIDQNGTYMKFNAYVLVQGHTHLPQLKFHRCAYQQGRTHSYCYANTGGWDQINSWNDKKSVESTYVEIEYHDHGCQGLSFINVNTIQFNEDGTTLPYAENELVMRKNEKKKDGMTQRSKGVDNFDKSLSGIDVYYDTRIPAIMYVSAKEVPKCPDPGDIQMEMRNYTKNGEITFAEDDEEAERIIALHRSNQLHIWGPNRDGIVDSNFHV